MSSFIAQEEEIKGIEDAIGKMYERLYDISSKQKGIPRPIIPLSPLGVKHDMYFLSWDWSCYFKDTSLLIARIADKFPEVIRKRLEAIDCTIANEIPNQNPAVIIPFTFPIYYNGSLHFLWSAFIDRFVNWLNSYLFLKEEGLRPPDKQNFTILQNFQVFIGQDWLSYLRIANEYLLYTLVGYTAIYNAIILDYEISVLKLKAQIKLRKNWMADLYVKKLFGGDSMQSILTSLSNYDSESLLQAIDNARKGLKQRQKAKLDLSQLNDAIDNMKDLFNWQEDLGDKSNVTLADANYDKAIDELEDSLDEMSTYIKKDSSNIKQKVKNLAGERDIATLTGNFTDQEVKWEDLGIVKQKQHFINIEVKQKATKKVYINRPAA